jgi:hypothetical protein
LYFNNFTLISGFRRDVKNVSVPSSRVKSPVKMGPIRCPETSVNYYHTTPRNTPEERRFQFS